MLKWTGRAAFVLAVLLLLASLLTFIPVVQTWLARSFAAWAGNNMGVEVRIASMAIRPWGAIHMDSLFISDLRGDTLLATDALRVQGLRLHTRNRSARADAIRLEGTRFALAIPEGDSISTLTRLLQQWTDDDTTRVGLPWRAGCRRVQIDGLHFSFHNENVPVSPFGVDFDHVDTHADIRASGTEVAGDSVMVRFEQLTLRDHSGFQLDQLSGNVLVSPRTITIEGMDLITPGSHLRGRLALNSKAWSDHSDFTERVELQLDLDSAQLQFADVAYFAPGLEGIDLPVRLSGRFRGPVSDLKGRDMVLHYGARTVFRGGADLIGLPDVENTFMVIDVDELVTDHLDLGTLPVPPFKEGRRAPIPDEVRRAGTLRFAGNFTGFPGSFTAYGRFGTASGTLRTDVSYERLGNDAPFTLSGRIATDGFELGQLVDQRDVGRVAADLRLKVSGRTLSTLEGDLEGDVPLLVVNDYPVTGITVNGHLERERFNGELLCRDPNLNMDFRGLADWGGRWPVVDFTAHVQHADLGALNVLDTAVYNSLSVLIVAQGTLAPDSLEGRIDLIGVSYCVLDDEHELGDIRLESLRHDGRSLLELRSSIADAEIYGEFLPTRVPHLLRSVIFNVFPALQSEVELAQASQQFNFDLRLKNTAPLFAMVHPELELAPGTRAKGGLDSRTFDVWLTAEIPAMRYGNISGDSLELVVDKTLDVLVFSLYSDRQLLNDSTYITGIRLSGKAYQDDVDIRMGWAGSSRGTSGDITLLGEVKGPSSVVLDLMPSTVFLGRGDWQNPEVARIRIDSNVVAVDSLVLHNAGQYVLLDGVIGKAPDAALAFELIDVQMDNFAAWIDGPPVHGLLSGDGRVLGLRGEPYLLSHLCLDSLTIDGRRVGDIRFSAVWNDESDRIGVNGTLTRGNITALDFTGTVTQGGDEELDLDLQMDRFDVAFLDPYMPEGISDLQGRVTGTVDMRGKIAEPRMEGRLDLLDAGLRIDYLNTKYTFSNEVIVMPDMFAADLVEVRDEEGNTGTMNATVLHDNFRDWNFNVSGTVERMLCLNTTVFDNALYHGRAYGTGEVDVTSFKGNLQITVDARTEPGTELSFPLGGSTEISSISFVRFISADTSAWMQDEGVDLTGVDLDLNVEVTPDARFELIFDPTVGDILSGRGTGVMEMGVTPLGEFSMRGDVEVSEGTYLFTLRNVVNKRFELSPGGHIVWYGDPFDAQLDLRAVYKLRAPLYDILYEKNDAYRRRMPVEVVMRLREKLMNPGIDFEVRLPSVDESIRTQVNSVLSTEQELNRQVFALIVLNKFLPPPNFTGPAGTANVAGTTGSELLSNQVSNWLSRISRDFDLGLNYRPGDNISQDELEVAVSTQLFNERLLLTTQVGVQYGETSAGSANTLVGDFQAEYLITDDGKFRMKGYSQSNDRNLNRADQSLTTQGVGIGYREEFNDLPELWQKFLNIFRPPEKVRRFD